MEQNQKYAPGWPGIPPRWTSSAKSGVGTALTHTSRVWFTLSHGILNEIYYPRVDHACTRDLGLIVTDGHSFFSEEKRHTQHQVAYLAEGVPAYRLFNTCAQGRYQIEKEIFASPQRDAVLQRIRFAALEGSLEDYHLYVLLASHLSNCGSGNTAWVGDYKGVPMLFAERNGYALALACSVPWVRRSVGFVGVSDGWQDLMQHKQMIWTYSRAENGNVALTGEVDLRSSGGTFVLALGFGISPAEAGHRALASLLDDFQAAKAEYIRQWQNWQHQLFSLKAVESSQRDLYRISAAVLRTHEAKRFVGGIIASLSIPWGFAKGDEDLGGYHLVWPRDLVETVGGLLAAGARGDARRVLHYLQVTQEADGYWPQNMWLDGTPYWNGVQMDETALPILLVDQARREGALNADDLTRFWPMVRRAAGYLVRNGPVTQQDRWEMDPGYSPFTLAAQIAALLAAADLADLGSEPRIATYLRETADTWNASIEQWTYVTDTELDHRLGIEGHYVRIAPPEKAEAASPREGFVPIKGRPPEQSRGPAAYIVGPDALALVRFGLRAPDDPRIVNTVKAIDELLRVETPFGPAWRRYVEDLYGEHEDGRPFDGTGIGRAWPLLTGERAHYELAAGWQEEAEKLLRVMESFANEGGMIPEQIWDAPDNPEQELFFGRPSGSAMPLVWAHAEYVKLRRSLSEGRVFDMPPQPVQRYLVEKIGSPYAIWRFNHKCRTIPVGQSLRLETLAPAVVHWSNDDWHTIHDTETRDTGLGVHLADLPTKALPTGEKINFTFYWPKAGRWENVDFVVIAE
ncbi:MAG: glucan 1,4-alpha-glucosidase [Acidobacteria bacterium]|nr:glucan 1,4-alpha-glucosidase [Acidobacteriota bacterium]